MGRARIGELLVDSKVITNAQLDEALQAKPITRKLGQVLVELGFVTETQLTQTLSLQLSVPWVSLYHIDFSRQLLNMVPHELAERFCAVPIFVRSVKKMATLYVAMDDPTNEAALEAIATSSGFPVKPMIASQSDIRSVIRVYYAGEAPPSSAGAAAPVAAPRNPPPPPKPPPPPMAARAPLPTVVDTVERFASEPLPDTIETEAARRPAPSGDAPDADPELEVSEYVPKKRSPTAPRMVALTLLDGTTLNLPARQSPVSKREGSIPPSAGGLSDQLTARDLVSALRAHAHGADASEILGNTDWQAMFAALLSLLLKKNLIADWEFVEELRNI